MVLITRQAKRHFKDGNEQYDSTMLAMNGVPQAAQPALWQAWDAARADILQESRPAAQLKQRFAEQSVLITSAIAATGRPLEALRYLPLLGRKKNWTVLIDGQSTEPVGFCRWIRFEANTLKLGGLSPLG